MRSERLRDLIRVLRAGHARTQRDIVAALRAQGHDITQATVSRDLQRIGATKVRVGNAFEYRLPDEVPRAGGGDLMERNLQQTLDTFAIEIVAAASLVVIQTAPGHAAAVARAIDLAAPPGVAGTVAGDDTIFVATPSDAAAAQVAWTWRRAGLAGAGVAQ